MLDPSIAKLLEEDRRYPLEAYIFVFEALNYAQNVLGMGNEGPSEPLPPAATESKVEAEDEGPSFTGLEEVTDTEIEFESDEAEERASQRHVTGQQLCQAIRRFALEQYGYMAKTVLNNWGIHATGDFGELVFNLIRIGRMRKTPQDCRADFEDVYQFDTAFRQEFSFTPPDEPPQS
jgi:uncharacterized repeat protein (TIGR04138 family)